MRKPNSSQSSGRSNRNSNRSGRPKGTGNANSSGSGNGNGSTNRKRTSNARTRNHQATQAWLEDPTAITSHIGRSSSNQEPNGNKRNDSRNQDNTSRNKAKPKSGSGKNRNNRNNRNDRTGGRDRNTSHRNQGATEKRAPSSNGSQETAAPQKSGGQTVAGIEPFDLFCAYHLGITREKNYKQSNINEVSRRFNADPGTIKQALKEYDMAPESLFDREFDMALAQLDIQVAPEGVDRIELARGIYQDFKDAPRVKRDWKKLIEEDWKENQKVFRN